MIYDCELTDTFGGEANYSWVRRESLEVSEGLTDRQIIRRAKSALGLTGCRCRTSNYGEGWELRPYGSCTVAFILPSYG